MYVLFLKRNVPIRTGSLEFFFGGLIEFVNIQLNQLTALNEEHSKEGLKISLKLDKKKIEYFENIVLSSYKKNNFHPS